eukprot:CAMPEP_0117679662 /NCGR_PEP_ID=MMETSP0804-20121206/17932_1 /TAXON_ID=1074897 /ORGANISM="Tetraselmis astigmatica, Strain CCMP880" /LENGTH=140 /DNA_ID=CAMNT_0005489095 /DNA_START=428 /DNA_END=852 /DNA_ORIENTATION=+
MPERVEIDQQGQQSFEKTRRTTPFPADLSLSSGSKLTAVPSAVAWVRRQVGRQVRAVTVVALDQRELQAPGTEAVHAAGFAGGTSTLGGEQQHNDENLPNDKTLDSICATAITQASIKAAIRCPPYGNPSWLASVPAWLR